MQAEGWAQSAWLAPFVVVIVAVASGRVSSATAGVVGLVIAAAAATFTAPLPFGASDAVVAASRGAWLGVLVSAIVLGGLFFWTATTVERPTEAKEILIAGAPRRRQLYVACFLVGPFAESATGFGVGQVTIAPVLARLRLSPLHAVMFGLFSQILVPWGALANGTMVGSQLSGVPPPLLGTLSALLSVPLLFGWLLYFWRLAATAGVAATTADLVLETLATAVAATLLIASNMMLGPESAVLAALGPMIAAFYLAESASDPRRLRGALKVGLPYAALVVVLAATRGIGSLNEFLNHSLAVTPFSGGPPWLPLLHPSTWLLLIGATTAFLMGRAASLPKMLVHACITGKRAVLAIVAFLAMAQVLLESGIAAGLANGLRDALGAAAPFSSPFIAAFFGILTGSGSSTNGLLMPAQVALAQKTQLSLPWLATIANLSASAGTILTPMRVAMGCALVGRPDIEQQIYLRAWPFLGIAMIGLSAAVSILIMLS